MKLAIVKRCGINVKAELEIARKQLSDSLLTSPIDGSVQVRHISPGQYFSYRGFCAHNRACSSPPIKTCSA